MRCRGITAKATQCTNKAIDSDCYCNCHLLCHVPSTPRITDWISNSQLAVLEYPIKTLNEAKYQLNYAMASFNEAYKSSGIIYSVRFFKVTTLLLLNPEFLNHNVLINKLIRCMSRFPHLASYREYFARKLSIKYREEARKKFVNSIISESILGQDIASVIVGFM